MLQGAGPASGKHFNSENPHDIGEESKVESHAWQVLELRPPATRQSAQPREAKAPQRPRPVQTRTTTTSEERSPNTGEAAFAKVEDAQLATSHVQECSLPRVIPDG